MQINPGDLVQLWTNYSASNGISTFKILDRTNGQTAPTITISYTPDGGTAEWIVEDATQGSYTMPNYNTVAWTKASSNGGNLITPLSAAIHEVKWTSNANHEGPDEVSNAQYITEPNQFSVTFWGYNG